MDKLTLFLLILFLGACTSKQHAPIAEGRKASSFFDLEIYFQQEAARLHAQSYRLKKRLKIDNIQEEQILETVNFEEELAVFSRLNINQPTWLDKYTVDSIFGGTQQLEAIEYFAIDTMMKTRKIIIQYDSLSEVKEITIRNKSYSFIMNSREWLNYYPNKGYSIETKQDILFFDDKDILLEAMYLEKE